MQATSQGNIGTPIFVDSAIVSARPADYVELTVDVIKVLKDWQASLMAHELLDKDGFVKGDDDITLGRLEKRENVRTRLSNGESLEKPILGIGIFDNVEIGAGVDVLATLVMEGIGTMPVHIRKNQLRDFDAFRA